MEARNSCAVSVEIHNQGNQLVDWLKIYHICLMIYCPSPEREALLFVGVASDNLLI